MNSVAAKEPHRRLGKTEQLLKPQSLRGGEPGCRGNRGIGGCSSSEAGRPAVGGAVGHRAMAQHMIATGRPQPDAGAVVQPQPPSRGLAFQAHSAPGQAVAEAALIVLSFRACLQDILCVIRMATTSEPPSVTGDNRFDDGEWAAWYALAPQQRLEESCKLWETYLKLGGTLDPEPDSQSPFFDPEEWRAGALDGRPGLRVVRRGGV
jgi:hypothetical protein